MGTVEDELRWALYRDPDGKCSQCRDWPPNRIIRGPGDPYGEGEPPEPRQCPRCGRERPEIRIEYVSDWRGMRNEVPVD